MKWLRILALAGVTLGLLGMTVYWSQARTGFATPAACLDAYREATQDGDIDRFWACLAKPLSAEIKQQHPNLTELAESLRTEMNDVKAWVQRLESPSAQSSVQIDVDEVRIDGNRRVRYRGVARNHQWAQARAAAINLRRLVNLGLDHDGGWVLVS